MPATLKGVLKGTLEGTNLNVEAKRRRPHGVTYRNVGHNLSAEVLNSNVIRARS